MGVKSYINAIVSGRGMAKSNTYAIYFSGGVITSLGTAGFQGINAPLLDETPSQVGQRVLLMCDEVSLPGVQSSTGSVSRFSGAAPVYYPTTKIYNDIQLSFMCDAEMQALNFLNTWYEKIYTPANGTKTSKSFRLNYPEEYQCNMIIEKRERSANSEIGILTAQYTCNGSWVYSIDQTPLSYGSSQLVKVTANLYYSNWDVKFFPVAAAK